MFEKYMAPGPVEKLWKSIISFLENTENTIGI